MTIYPILKVWQTFALTALYCSLLMNVKKIKFSEVGDLKTRIEALKKVITMILNGEKIQGLLMTVIRFVMPLQDHTIKKLLLIFWEVVPKYSGDGKMLHEFILVCDAYRKVIIEFELQSFRAIKF